MRLRPRAPAFPDWSASSTRARELDVRGERMQLVLPGLDHAPGRLRDLVPGAWKIAECLRDDQPGLVAQPLKQLVLGVHLTQRRHGRAEEERSRLPLARVTEGPDGFAVGGRNRPLERVLDAVFP